MQEDAKSGGGTNWASLVASLAWPLVALIVLALFYGPIKRTLDKAAHGEAEEISVGAVTVRFSARAIAELPDPPADVAEKLNSLTEFDRETLISIGSYSPHDDSCTVDGFVAAMRSGTEASNAFFASRVQNIIPYRQHIGAHARLERLGLVSLSPRDNSEEAYCLDGHGRTATLTPLGERTRRYYLDLVNRTLLVTSAPQSRTRN